MSRREANGDFVFRYQHHSVDREVVAVLRVFDNDMARRNIRPAVARVVGAERQFRDVDFAPFHDDFLTRTIGNEASRNRRGRAPDGLVENIFLRQTQSQSHTAVTRQKLADYGNRRTFHIFEKQRRAVGPLVEDLADSAELMLRIHLSSNGM